MRAKHKAKQHKASGGKILNAGGNPNVERESEEYKRGGKAKRHSVDGDKPKHRLDKFRRGGRTTGGSTGADKHPLSSAANVRHVAGEVRD